MPAVALTNRPLTDPPAVPQCRRPGYSAVTSLVPVL